MENKLQQAKDTIAKKYGYDSFDEYFQKCNVTIFDIDQVAKEYHRLMSEWVSVDEKLPEVDEEYLLYVYDEGMEQYFHSVGY